MVCRVEWGEGLLFLVITTVVVIAIQRQFTFGAKLGCWEMLRGRRPVSSSFLTLLELRIMSKSQIRLELTPMWRLDSSQDVPRPMDNM
jgi:hypothetical protein